jgi:ubiquinone/menaquinone biosynthesis C-methylase UbiE
VTEETEEYYTENARQWSEKYGEIHEAMLPILEKFVEEVGSGKVLDAGCGNGKHTEFFAKQEDIRSEGIDSAPGILEEAVDRRASRKAEYSRMDVQDLEFYDGTFDGVWCNTVMQFIPHESKPQAISELSRVLRSGGIFYITFKLVSEQELKEEGEEARIYVRGSDGITRYLVTEEEAEELLEKAGLEIFDSQVSDELEGPPVCNILAKKK